MRISRKNFLLGTASAAAGASMGFLGRPLWYSDLYMPVNPTPPPRKPGFRPLSTAPFPEAHGVESFSQCGEDRAIEFIFVYLAIDKMTYLDIGAHHPFENSNTYYFYRKGYRGVLVEPNVDFSELLRGVRPEDTTLVAGIGASAAKEADYYVMSDSLLNTFSKEEVEHQEKVSKGRIAIRDVIKMPLLNINDVIAEHFKEAPTFVSIDTEGLDLAILKSLDFSRYRPKVVCAETIVYKTHKTRPEIAQFMESQGYVAQGGSMVNTIFVDSKLL
jgi:FkbM family methyltransferase